jgi:hypothetical protein
VLGLAIRAYTSGICNTSSSWWYDRFLPWIEPLATVGAFMAALVAAWYAARVFAVERARDLRREEAERRRQAEQIAAWFASLDEGGDDALNAVLSNPSGAPIFEVVVEAALSSDEPLVWAAFVAILPPDGGRPQSTWLAGLASAYAERSRTATLVLWSLPIQVTFTDASGARWRRDPAGRLTAVPRPGVT